MKNSHQLFENQSNVETFLMFFRYARSPKVWIFYIETNEKEDFERQVPKLFLSDLGKKNHEGVYAYEIFSTQAKCWPR